MNGILLDSLPGKKRTHKHRITLLRFRRVLLQFECGTRNLRVVHGGTPVPPRQIASVRFRRIHLSII